MSLPVVREVVVNANGRAYKTKVTVQADVALGIIDRSNPINPVPVAKQGQLTTRTNNTDGTITMNPGHGLTTGRMDLYWSGGKRRGVTGTVTGDSVAISGGAGDNLPAQNSTIYAVNPAVETFNVVGNNASALLLGGDAGVTYQVVLATSGDAEILNPTLVDTGLEAGYEWVSGSGVTNPIAGQTVAKIYVSHFDLNAAKNFWAIATGS